MSETATELKVEGREGGCGTIDDDDDDDEVISGASVEATRHETKPKTRAVAGCADARTGERSLAAAWQSRLVVLYIIGSTHTQNASIYDVCNYIRGE